MTLAGPTERVDYAHAVGAPIVATMADGQTYTFSRATPRILAELGSWHRAQTDGNGGGWSSIEECYRLVQTIEGMEWLCWRCAAENHPDVKRAGLMGFRKATNDFALLVKVSGELTDYPDPIEGTGPGKPEGETG